MAVLDFPLFFFFFCLYLVLEKSLKTTIPFLYYRYAFEGVLQAIYGFDRENLDCDDDHCAMRSPDSILESLDVDEARFYIDFIILCVFFIVLRTSCYFVLRWRVKAQR